MYTFRHPVGRNDVLKRPLLLNAREETSARIAQALPPSTHRPEQESQVVRGEEHAEESQVEQGHL